MADDEVLAEILTLVDEVQGIILLDLKGIESTWGEHIKEMYDKLNVVRALCGDKDYDDLLDHERAE